MQARDELDAYVRAIDARVLATAERERANADEAARIEAEALADAGRYVWALVLDKPSAARTDG